MRKGIVEDMEHCMICGREHPHIHHIFFGSANRKISDRYGMVAPLCREHHLGNISPHRNREIDLALKRRAQEYFEEHIGSREAFREAFGKSYL